MEDIEFCKESLAILKVRIDSLNSYDNWEHDKDKCPVCGIKCSGFIACLNCLDKFYNSRIPNSPYYIYHDLYTLITKFKITEVEQLSTPAKVRKYMMLLKINNET